MKFLIVFIAIILANHAIAQDTNYIGADSGTAWLIALVLTINLLLYFSVLVYGICKKNNKLFFALYNILLLMIFYGLCEIPATTISPTIIVLVISLINIVNTFFVIKSINFSKKSKVINGNKQGMRT